MTIKENEALQKQILFNETQKTRENDKKPFNEDSESIRMTEQVVFDNDSYLDSSQDDNTLHEINESNLNNTLLNQDTLTTSHEKKSWLWRIIGVSFFMLIAIEASHFFVAGFEQSPILTSLYAILLGSLSIVAGHSLWHELVGLKQFKKRQEMKRKANSILLANAEESSQSGKDFCDAISDNLPNDLVFESPKEYETWQSSLSAEYNATELVQLYSRVVLSKVDEKALNEVAKFSTEAVVLIALSPVALIDMLIMLSRNLRMINKIAGLYGLKLGYWSRIQLIKQVFVNMAYAGASELIADYGSDMLGTELFGKLSTRFAQGLGAGLLTARLGAKTMELCRPIPFDEKPKLTHVRQKIAQQIKSLFNPV